MEVKSLLDSLKATVVAYVDRKRHGMLISSSMQKLERLSSKRLPKYLQSIRVMEPLTKDDQLDEKLSISGIKMLIFSIIPNLDAPKNKIYINILQTFFLDNNCKTYGKEFQKFGFILADVTSEIVDKLIQKSTFIFKINLIPDGIAQEIRESVNRPISENSSCPQTTLDLSLPKVVLMDSGVNDLPALRSVLLDRQAYIFQNPDDEHDRYGHGTPIANLIAFGETNELPVANIISYKILSSVEKTCAMQGLIRGVEEYADQTRLFVTSIGVSHMPPNFMTTLDRLVQDKNVCLVASGGNLSFSEIKNCLIQGGRYPDYLRGYPVIPPANLLNVVAVGSIAKKISLKYTSLAPVDGVSPHSKCGTGAYDLFECKKPQFVEHGGNVNVVDANYNMNHDDVGVDTIDKSGQPVSLTGSSFSSPLFVRKLASIEHVYGNKTSNIEIILAILYLSCPHNSSIYTGYGEPKSLTHTDHNSAIYLAEGIIGFTHIDADTMTTPVNEIKIYVPSNIGEIKFCLTHSDDFYKNIEPTLETYFEVTATKFGNDSPIKPENSAESNSKTNVRILTYKFSSKSMQSIWTFSIRPRVTHDILTEDKRSISVRFGCAVLLTRKPDKRSSRPLAREIAEDWEQFAP